MLCDTRIRHLTTPFKVAFRHATAERAEAQSILIEFESEGVTGIGEGCPREYVTGESIDSAMRFLRDLRSEACGIRSVAELRHWTSANRKRIDAAPAAWCALELAMLDCFARRESVSVETLLGLPPLDVEFRYTAILGDSADATFAGQLKQYQSLGFREFKLKVSGNAERDRERMQTINAKPDVSLRIDANNLWRNLHDLKEWKETAQPRVFAVEEPLETRDLAKLSEASDVLGTPIILDENFLRLEQLEPLARDAQRWILNVRVSKMGGLLRSLEIVEAARAAGLRIVVGAQVGETSVLTRAALPVAQAAGDLLIGQEGAFGEYLLERDVVEPVLQFGKAGKLNASEVLHHPGWGLRLR